MNTPPRHPRLTVVEASAGTGKTHRITELVAEHVVELGVPIERILVVTFTRAATAELRDRIRRRLVELARTSPDDEHAERARRAVTTFDLAVITTIHGFCHQALGAFGAPDLDLTEGLVSDDAELRNEVINDAILTEVTALGTVSPLTALFTDGEKPSLDEDKVRKFVRVLLTHPGALVHLDGDHGIEVDAAWRAFLARVRDRVLERRDELGVVTHDEVVRRVVEAVRVDAAGCRTLAERFQLVLIDEFQDTDAQQWEIFSRIFLDTVPGSEHVRMLVVGDPKQAIYAFRGADVHAYLVARERAQQAEPLDESWRMEPGLITATNLLFRGAGFGEAEIVHHDLRAPKRPEGQRIPAMSGDSLGAPVTVRVVPNDATSRKNGPPNYVTADIGRQLVGADVADMIVELLASPTHITPAVGPERALRPSDIAVLVGTHDQADRVAAELRSRGVRSVQRGTANVAKSDAATQWRWLLDAMARPATPSAAALAGLSWFVGWAPERLATAGDDDIVTLQEHLVDWRRALGAGGVPALLSAVRATTDFTATLLARPDGERAVTDLDHLAELLHATHPDGAAPDELLDVLDLLAAEAAEVDERTSRRIDSDDDAIQLLTIHASKGLQFPVTLVPFTWPGGNDPPPTFHEGHDLLVDATIGERSKATKELTSAEQQGTDARLLYVALTRAQHRLVVWWGQRYGGGSRPITEVLLTRTTDGARVDRAVAPPKGDLDEVSRRLDTLAKASKGKLRWAMLRPAQQLMPLPMEPQGALEISRFTRSLPRGRARHSFSSLIAGTHAPPTAVASAADDEVLPGTGESAAGVATADITTVDITTIDITTVGGAPIGGAPIGDATVEATLGANRFFAALEVAGTELGTAMHELFEVLDFAARPLDAEVRRGLGLVWPHERLHLDVDPFVDAIVDVLHSPTGPLLGHRSLAELTPRDRRDELNFELPLATSGTPVRTVDIAALMLDHLPDLDPVRPFAERLRAEAAELDPMRVDLRGHLTGSIDLLVRVPDGSGGQRFVVCDYKTNRLAPTGSDADLLDAYLPDRLWPAMFHHHYPLQALLYTVAVHRFLRWRLRGYEPTQHLGGAAYLFVRGMAGPSTPLAGGQPAGICSWPVPPSLTVALSDLLDGRRP